MVALLKQKTISDFESLIKRLKSGYSDPYEHIMQQIMYIEYEEYFQDKFLLAMLLNNDEYNYTNTRR